ncbi:MAG: purine-nucleoside phosphorylase [Pleomorphochaeta sp.]
MSLHIEAKNGEIAKKVLLPGDPLRAKYIAENYLENAVCYNNIRGMLGYTGIYKGEKISVQGTGMGMPSFSIYANELINDYGCETLIRIGTCGTINENVHLRDLVLVNGTHTDSAIYKQRFNNINFAAVPSFDLLYKAYNTAKENNLEVKVGTVFVTDLFYMDNAKEVNDLIKRYNTLAIEMESAELYALGAKYKVDVLTFLTVSDDLIRNTKVEPKDRQTSFTQMMEVALETIISK